jgi:hypothetical protein
VEVEVVVPDQIVYLLAAIVMVVVGRQTAATNYRFLTGLETWPFQRDKNPLIL